MEVYSVSGSKRGIYQSCSFFHRNLKWPTTTDIDFYRSLWAIIVSFDATILAMILMYQNMCGV